MYRFREFLGEGILDDVLNLGSKFLYFWKSKWILNTKHGYERIAERLQISIDELKKLFKTAIESAITHGVEKGKTYLFYSQSLRQGFVAAGANGGNIELITFLPKGKSYPKPGTERIVVEGIEQEIVIDFVIEME